MHHYYLSFYGQTNANVHECMRQIVKAQPLVKGYVLLEEPKQCGPNPASHTVDLWFGSREDCMAATTTNQALAQVYLPYSVGPAFVAVDRDQPLDLTPDLVAFPKERLLVNGPRPRTRPILHTV